MAVWLFPRRCWLLRYPVAVAHVSSRVTSSFPTFQEKPRSLADLPHVSTMELIYRMVFQGFYNRIHELQIYEKQQYGPIYRDGLKSVSVSSPKLLEEVLRKDDKFPSRGDMSAWKDYRDMKGFGYGPFTEEGERWYSLRQLLNKRMLHLKSSLQYGGTINEVVRDFTKRIQYLCQCSPTGDRVTDVANELYLFSLESIASILFEARLGCLEKDIPAGTQDFINAITQMFKNNPAVFIAPKWSHNLLPYWRRYIAGWDGIFTFAKGLIDKKLEAIQQCVETSLDVQGEYLTYLLSNTDMSMKDVYGTITELLLAGVDTTSNTLTWTLHQLSRNPEIQNRLYKEVSTFLPADQSPSATEITQIPYLRAVIKEVLRMYPVVPVNGRVVSENSISVGGYQFPKKTPFLFCHYAISHDEDTFPEPFTFKPERWLRDENSLPAAFGSLPFGFGVRSCVGRRIAELEMYMVLVHLIRQYEIKPDPAMGELRALTRTVLIPEQPINLHFVDRRCDNAA
ncbi:sterol 26-hydroxylase, mitochondrial [Echeneis naucrates]|uniref:sterol 26-hydroxylase, mitochondrial n=1 Tax=Echeneis naucrates TaxID=173247 RepID=UPI0011133771|nr:sterol 26-hydroxylase, mitochondrial [Echeneis naucrates]